MTPAPHPFRGCRLPATGVMTTLSSFSASTVQPPQSVPHSSLHPPLSPVTLQHADNHHGRCPRSKNLSWHRSFTRRQKRLLPPALGHSFQRPTRHTSLYPSPLGGPYRPHRFTLTRQEEAGRLPKSLRSGRQTQSSSVGRGGNPIESRSPPAHADGCDREPHPQKVEALRGEVQRRTLRRGMAGRGCQSVEGERE